MGAPIAEVPEACAIANPITWVDARDVPFWVFHGSDDSRVPICQSELLVEALQEAGVPVEFVVGDGVNHTVEHDYFDGMITFFNNVL